MTIRKFENNPYRDLILFFNRMMIMTQIAIVILNYFQYVSLEWYLLYLPALYLVGYTIVAIWYYSEDINNHLDGVTFDDPFRFLTDDEKQANKSSKEE